jgi:hypothetical protein
MGNNWGRDYTIGSAPMYALLADAGLDNLGYLTTPWPSPPMSRCFSTSHPIHYDPVQRALHWSHPADDHQAPAFAASEGNLAATVVILHVDNSGLFRSGQQPV